MAFRNDVNKLIETLLISNVYVYITIYIFRTQAIGI